MTDLGELSEGEIQARAIAGLGARIDGLGHELSRQRFDRERDYGLMANFHLTLGRMADTLERTYRQAEEQFIERALDAPIYADFAFTKTFPTTGDLAFNCGGPAQGRIWHVKRLVVGGLTLATAAAGSAEAYSSGYEPTSNTSLSNLHDATILISSPQTDLPNIGFYEDGQFVVQSGEYLWVVVRSGTAGQQYVVAGTAKDHRQAPFDSVFTT